MENNLPFPTELSDISLVFIGPESNGIQRAVMVGIADSGVDGDRKVVGGVPTIGVCLSETGAGIMHLTWDEARAVAKALNDVADVAEFG